MQLKHAFLVLALGVLAGCGGTTRTAEIPGGVLPEEERETSVGQRPQSWLGRTFGNDDTPNAGPCPLMGVLYDSSRVINFATEEERYANITYTGEMRGVRGFCRYTGDSPIEMNLEIDMAFGRGPAATEGSRVYRYWVAIARRGVAPIEKQYYDVLVEFENGRPVREGTEEIQRIVIPRANSDVNGNNFEVLVGFELTPQQLQFNRDGKRFRIDAAAPQPS